jgi:dATP pyrophosphohydrolase
MARAPYQVTVYPYFIDPEGRIEYVFFFRLTERYGDFWQSIAGGGEDDEKPIEAARREAEEEAGLDPDLDFYQLEAMAMLPADNAAGYMMWGKDVIMVPEYAFAVQVASKEVRLSPEHVECRWVDYETAQELLKWDSNRNALWELNYRLTEL